MPTAIKFLVAACLVSLVVFLGLRDGERERAASLDPAAADMEVVAVKLRAVTAADTVREISMILAELAQAWYAATDSPLRFNCETSGFDVGTWTAPIDGAPVFKYNIEMELRGHVFCDTSLVLPVPAWATEYRARAQGETSSGVTGPWGAWGPWRNDQ